VVAVLPPGSWWRRRSDGGICLSSVAVPLLLVPAGLLLVESSVLQSLFQQRYVLYGEAGVALLAGAGVYRIGRWLAGALRRPELVLVPGLAVCLCTLLLQLQVQHGYRTPQSRAYNFGGPAFYVGSHARRGDGVLFMSSFFRKAELGYPEQFRDTSDFALAVPPLDVPYRGANKPLPAVLSLMLARRRIWVIGYLPSPTLPAPMRTESQVLLQDFTRLKARSYRGMWLTLWVRRTSTAKRSAPVVVVPSTVEHWGSFFGGKRNVNYDLDSSPVALTVPGTVAEVGTSNSTQYALLTNGGERPGPPQSRCRGPLAEADQAGAAGRLASTAA